MKIIIPMAGRGTRLRPHTITVPKPLVPVVGKPIVQHLVEDLAKAYGSKIDEIAYIVGDFGTAVEKQLVSLAERLGAKGSIYYQKEQLGTAHAILCAKESMSGPVIVAFADTLFKADFKFDSNQEGIIWVKQVSDPSAFGVVKLDEKGHITDFVEKPDTFVSDLAIIGIYYFKDAVYLRDELQYLIDNDIREKGEYQLTNALENMKRKGTKFSTHSISEWLDCGNKDAVIYANSRVLEIKPESALIASDAKLTNVTIIPPVHIGSGAVIKNSVIGPHVTIGRACRINNSVISKSLIQDACKISYEVLENTMLGSSVELFGKPEELSLGDFSVKKN
jgi:glucose-1-phosphate thymidylyltransferase